MSTYDSQKQNPSHLASEIMAPHDERIDQLQQNDLLKNHAEIKPYIDSYRKQLLAVWESSVLATHDFLDPTDFDEIRGLVRSIDFNAFAVYCLMINLQVAGFIGVSGRRIEMLFLAPEYIGRGYGTMLMDFAFSKFGADEVDVNEQNHSAVAFYRKLGFETFERSEKDSQGNDYPILKMKLKKAVHGNLDADVIKSVN